MDDRVDIAPSTDRRADAAPTLYSGERALPTAAMLDRAARAASGLEALGVGVGDTIAIYLRNDFPYLEASIAAGMVGAYVVPVNWHYSVDEARYIFENSDTKLAVVHADLLRRIEGALPPQVRVLVVETPPEIAAAYDVASDEIALRPGETSWTTWLSGYAPMPAGQQSPPGSMLYTSGTTGRPKGVRRAPRTPEQIEAGAQLVRDLFGIGPWEDRPHLMVQGIAGPLYHTAPNGWAMSFAQIGANLVLMPRFHPEELLAEIERRRITHLLMVPTMFVRLLKLPPEVRARYDLSSLRFVMHGAAPCPPHVKKAMIAWWGPIIWEHYGNTETGALTLCDSEQWLAHPGTVGRILPDCDLKVLDESGRETAIGEPGEIAAWRKAFADFTYHGDDEKRRKAEKAPGLIALGDIGYVDGERYVYLSGRASDMIISGGVNIYPAEIESELLKMPGVADCAVFGIPDEEFGESVCAVIQPERHPPAPLRAEDVKTYLRGRLGRYKIPKRIEFRNDLPREDSGKIFKRKLRDPYWNSLGRQI